MFSGYKQNTAFSLVELLVTISVMVILSSMAFIGLSGNISKSRDSQRISDFASIQTSLKLYKQKRGSYPLPGDSFSITYNSTPVATQGFLNENVKLSTMDSLPEDPHVHIPYFYSVTNSRQEFQLAATLENRDDYKSLVTGDYNSVSKNILPSIIFAFTGGAALPVETPANQNLSLFDKSVNNLPYSFKSPHSPFSKNTDLSNLLIEASQNNTFWQNSDFTSCEQILDAGKSIGDGEYQILDTSTNNFVDTSCTGM